MKLRKQDGWLWALAAAMAAAVCGAAVGGEIDPPAGPVSPTMKTLDEVEPRTLIDPADAPIVINQAGSYYLIGNLIAGGFGQTAITVNASDVTLDLNGFVIGPSEVGLWDAGIEIHDTARNVVILNGTIKQSAGRGVDAQQSVECQFVQLRMLENDEYGIIAGERSVVRECEAIGNGQGGISVAQQSIVDRCSSGENGQSGIQASDDSVVIGCASYENGSSGYIIGDGSHVSNCTATSNDGFGFGVFTGVSLIGCSASENTSSGISTGSGGVVDGCSSFNNDLDGIGPNNSVVRNSNFTGNGRHGMFVSSSCLIENNVCDGNADIDPLGAGILIAGSDNRIDGNTTTDNAYGVRATQSGNIIVRNSASGNTTAQYDILAGNDLGTVQNTPVGAGAWDNFTF